MRVLLVRAGALGDLLLLRRTIASLKRAGHDVVLLAPAASGAAVTGPGAADADQLLAWDGPEVARLMTDDGLTGGALYAELERVDAVLAYTRSETLCRNLEAITGRVIRADPEPAAGSGHASGWFSRPLRALGVAVADPVPTESPSPEEAMESETHARGLDQGFLALHPGSGSPAKNWPPQRFATLVEDWWRARGSRAPWLLAVGPAERDGLAALTTLHPVVIARAWPARMLGALLSRTGVYIGNDSGVSHLAAAWGAPTVALFGPTDPDVWSPVGPRVCVVRSPTGRMEDIAVEDVLPHMADSPPPGRGEGWGEGRQSS